MRINEITQLIKEIPKERREAFLSQMRMQASVSEFQGKKFREDLFIHTVRKLEK